jgi:hypothetical protein
MTVKHARFKCIKYTNKRDKLYDVSDCNTIFLKYDPFWHQIKSVCHVQLENNLIGVKVQGALNVVEHYFTTTLSYNSKLVQGKTCCKGVIELKA